MKNLKLLLLIVCTFVSYSAASQHKIQNGLWRGIGVFNDSGKRMGFNLEEFIYIKNDSVVSVFGYGYDQNTSNSEITLQSSVRDYFLTDGFKLKNERVTQTLKVKTDTIAIYENNFSMSFAHFKTKVSPPIKSVEEAILGTTFGMEGNLKVTFQKDRKAIYLDTHADRFWTSDYLLMQFEDFVFLKSSTSAPILVLSVDKKRIKGLWMDFRLEPKEVVLERQ